MRSVYFYWFIKSIYAKTILLGGVMVLSAWHISFVDVAKNTLHSHGFSMFKYLMASFVSADMVSKFILTAITFGVFTVGLEIIKRKNAWRFAEMRFR